MADGIIKGSEFISNDLFKRQEDLIKNQSDILKGQLKIIEQAKKFNKQFSSSSLSSFNKVAKQSDDNLSKLYKAQNKSVVIQKDLSRIEKERIKIKQQQKETLTKLLAADSKSYEILQKGKLALQQKNKTVKQNIILEKAAKDSLIRKRAELKKLTDEYDNASGKIRRKLAPAVKKLSQEVEKAEKATNRHQRGVGKYTKGVQAAATKMLIWYAAIKTAIRGIGKIIKTTASFEKQMDKVAAVTGATSEELEQLTDNAKLLGSTTSKSATQVGQLQEEFAKLGFTTSEIINATEATIRLSEAAGSDLAQSAKVAGSTIRGFGLDASESQRIVDVMAKSFASSALDINKFETAMAQVAPVAKTAGVEIEEATAYLSALVDSGLDASTAGTSLRNMFLENAKEGRTFAEGLDILNNASDKSSAAMDLFGKRGAVAAIVLSDNIEKTKELTKAYEGAEGAAADMAATMQDNLTGDVTKLSSAWEGLVLSFDDGSGGITKSLRGVIQATSSLVTWFTRLNTSAEKLLELDTFDEAEEKIKAFRDSLGKDLLPNELINLFQYKLGRIKDSVDDNNEYLKEANEKLQFSALTATTARMFEAQKIEAQTNLASYRNQIRLLNNLINEQRAILDKEAARKLQEEQNTLNRSNELKKQANDAAKKQTIKDEEELNSLLSEMSISELDNEIDRINTEMIASGEKYNQEIENLIKIYEIKEKFANQEEVNRKRRDAAEIEFSKTKKDLLINAAFETANFIGSLISREETLTARKYDKQIHQAEKAGKDTEKIEQEKAREIAKIQRKQAILNKSIALADIAINTAMAVQSVASTGGGTRYADFGISAGILTALVVANGAAQAATVLSQPLPEIPSFFKGGKHDGGTAELHGQEIVSTKQGDFFTNWDKYEGKLVNLPKSEITPNKDIFKYDIENIKNNSVDLNGGISAEKMAEIMKNNTKELKKTIANIPQPHYEGLTLTKIKRGNSTEKYYNNKYKMR